MGRRHGKRREGPTLAEQADRHVLYQKSVQAPEAEVEFFDKAYRELRDGRKALLMREDFCGTALLATTWCQSDPERRAVGADICADTLAWGREHNLGPAGEEVARRVELVEADVREANLPLADITCALNFSYCIFKTREELREYFEAAHRGLKSDGLLILDLFGGTECQDELEEETDIDDEPATYIWEHASFNPIKNHIVCHIHFDVPGFGKIERAFTYDWRLWTLPELREILVEAGFSKAEVYLHGFDENGESDEIFRLRKTYENAQGWIAYVVGVR